MRTPNISFGPISKSNLKIFREYNFFNSEKFQLWSYSNLKELVTHDVTKHKIQPKKYISAFTKNEIYTKNKTTSKDVTIDGNLIIKNIKVNDGTLTIDAKEGELININGQVNIEQSAYTEDIDVINIDKNTSFVDYSKLTHTFYTKLGGSGSENNFKNNKCVDKYNNLYIIGESSSEYINIFDSTNNNVPVAELLSSSDEDDDNIIIVKYNHLGEYQWSTHIGGFDDKDYPSLVCDSEGNVVVCFKNDGENNPFLILNSQSEAAGA
jgi:hypothetical protein